MQRNENLREPLFTDGRTRAFALLLDFSQGHPIHRLSKVKSGAFSVMEIVFSDTG
jgi:hypothetical protein